jgi:uncharacterized Zn finger protein
MNPIQIASNDLSMTRSLAMCAKGSHVKAVKDLADAKQEVDEAEKKVVEINEDHDMLKFIASLQESADERVYERAAEEECQVLWAFTDAQKRAIDMAKSYQDKAAIEKLMRDASEQASINYAYASYAFWEAQKVRDDRTAERVLECAEEASAGCGF